MDEIAKGKNYLRNIETSRKRTIRVEVVGEVNEAEKHFLDGIAYFTAGTLSKDDINHTTYVSELMTKLIKSIVAYIRKGKKNEGNK